jgi:hypothetical protein
MQNQANYVQFRLMGKTGEIDGYLEILLGLFGLSGIVLNYKLSKTTREDGKTEIYIDVWLKAPPLGHLGENDIPERERAEGDK